MRTLIIRCPDDIEIIFLVLMDRLAYDTMVTTTVALADNNIDADVVGL